MARPRTRAAHEGRDLAVTTDFRSVFSEVVRGHLGLTDTQRGVPGIHGRAAARDVLRPEHDSTAITSQG